MKPEDERALEITQLRDRLGPVQFSDGSSPASPRYSADYEKAALLSSFDPDALEMSPDSFRQVVSDCLIVVRDQVVRYALQPDVRRRVLRQLGSRARMRETLVALDDVPSDPVQEAISHIVDKQQVVEDGASIERLQAAHEALSWFADIIPTEPPDALRARIEAIGYQDRFERLVGDNFVGREDALQVLREYVGFRSESTGLRSWLRQRFTSFDEKPALMITGPGGMGKSTLLARFLLDHAADREVPFVYVNFDSPAVRASDPKTILSEGLRQLAIQYPQYSMTITATRDRWQTELLELADLTQRARRARDAELSDRLRHEFVSLLHSLGFGERPFLVMLDTFEVVQERQRGDLGALYEFLRALQRDHPVVRTIISGRAGLQPEAADPISTTEYELEGLDRTTSAAYLRQVGLLAEHAERVAAYLVPEESGHGASPLSLRVAAEIWSRDLERSELDADFWAQLRAGRIQAQLITRYVRHTDRSSQAGQLALPALMLRRVDQASLAQVVAPAWDQRIDPDQERVVFDDLAGLISLVLERGGSTLTPRFEVQYQVVDLLRDLETDRVATLRDLAVEHYAALSERADIPRKDAAEDRFDEIVHRLARGDDEDVVRGRWWLECAQFVSGTSALLPAEASAMLEELAGYELTRGMRASASLRVWQGEATTRARRALDTGDPRGVVTLAAERDDWAKASELSLLLARAFLDLRQPLDTLDTTAAALDEVEPRLSSALVADLHQVAAEAAYELTRPQDVLDHAEEALAIARDREDERRAISALLVQLGAQLNRDPAVARSLTEELRHRLATYDGELPERDEDRLFALLVPNPGLVPAAVRAGALRRLSTGATRELARRVAAVDEQVSLARGEKPGYLTRAAGLMVGTSITRTWQDVLLKPDAVARDALLRVLDQDVASTTALRDHLARALAVAVTTGAAETDTVERLGIGLNQRRRRALTEALAEECGLPALDSILAEEFDRSLGSMTTVEPGDQRAVSGLVETAEHEDWLGALVIAARNRYPSAPKLLQVANELDLSTVHFSTSRLERAVGKPDLPVVLARLGQVEGQIARLERGKKLVGTGILVGPDLVLVAASSLDADRGRAVELTARFGLKTDAKGDRRHDEGVRFPVVSTVGHVPYADGSGFALVRVDNYPADEPLGSGRAQRLHERRGFADISRSAAMTEGQNALVCWQQQTRLELHVERHALTADGSIFRMPGLGVTSEGAPCFNRALEFLGIVLTSRSRTAVVVPGSQVWRAITDHGFGETVGMPLA